MSALLALAAALALAASASVAPPAAMAPAFANTIVSTYPDGRHGRLYLEPDGGWKAVSRAGRVSSGRWTAKGERVCMRQARPFPFFLSYCTPVVAGGVGTTWRAKAPTGEPISVMLQAGRAGEPQG